MWTVVVVVAVVIEARRLSASRRATAPAVAGLTMASVQDSGRRLDRRRRVVPAIQGATPSAGEGGALVVAVAVSRCVCDPASCQ